MPTQPGPNGTPRRKEKTFGGASLDRIAVSGEPASRHVSLYLSFEEALKLHLSLSQLLGHLNGYNRSTKAGKSTAVRLFIKESANRMFVEEGRTGTKSRTPTEETGAEADE